jgi:peroxiredoxin
VPTVADTRPLGLPLPDTTLPDADGVPHHLPTLAAGGPLLLAFMCNHCPYVQHVETVVGALATELATRGVATVAVMSNDVGAYPEDDVDGMRAQAARAGWDFPYLIDRDQALARALGAACTPDVFLFGADGALAHRGAVDGSTPGNGLPATGDAVRRAVEAVLAGVPVPDDLPPALGCGIKWAPGNEPG